MKWLIDLLIMLKDATMWSKNKRLRTHLRSYHKPGSISSRLRCAHRTSAASRLCMGRRTLKQAGQSSWIAKPNRCQWEESQLQPLLELWEPMGSRARKRSLWWAPCELRTIGTSRYSTRLVEDACPATRTRGEVDNLTATMNSDRTKRKENKAASIRSLPASSTPRTKLWSLVQVGTARRIYKNMMLARM